MMRYGMKLVLPFISCTILPLAAQTPPPPPILRRAMTG